VNVGKGSKPGIVQTAMNFKRSGSNGQAGQKQRHQRASNRRVTQGFRSRTLKRSQAMKRFWCRKRKSM